MNDATDNKRITQYLLGALPEPDAERLDELSIIDDKFADDLRAAEKDLVDAYVNGELSGAALAQFESYYLASPLRREQLEFARTFQNFGAKALAQPVREAGSEVTAQRKSAGGFSSLMSSLTLRPAFRWGLAAAALVFLIGGSALLFQNIRLRQQMTEVQARRNELQQRESELQKQLENQRTANSTIEQELARVREERARLEEQLHLSKPQPSPGEALTASLVLTPQMRGAGQISTAKISAETQRLAIQLQLEPNEYSTYSVTLMDQSNGQTLWRSGKMKASAAGDRKSLSIGVRAPLLHVGVYRVLVSGISSSGASEVVGEYPFRVSR